MEIFLFPFLFSIVTNLQVPINIIPLNDNNPYRLLSSTVSSTSVFTNNTIYLMTIPLCFGEPKQCFNLMYDTFSHVTYVYNSTMNMRIRHTYYITRSQTKEIEPNKSEPKKLNIDLSGNEIKDLISNFTNEKTIPNTQNMFTFYLINILTNSLYLPYDGVIGLSRFYDTDLVIDKHKRINASNEVSIMEHLYKNKYINKKIFAHKIYKKYKQGVFYLGETGISSKSNKVNYCISEPYTNKNCYFSYWQCRVSSFLTGNDLKINLINSTIIFNSGYYYVQIPQFYKDRVFLSLLGQEIFETCNEFSLDEDGMALFCPELPKAKLPDIVFQIIDGFNVTLKGDQLFMYTYYNKFDKNYWGYQSLITYNYFLQGTFIMGKIFMENYHMIFDYENNKVGLIEIEENEKMHNVNVINSVLINVINIECLLLMFGIGVILGNKCILK